MGAVAFDSYSLLVNLACGSRMVIQRQDKDRKRTVAFVDSLAEWDRFVAALRSGLGEVGAVHAIDVESPKAAA